MIRDILLTSGQLIPLRFPFLKHLQPYRTFPKDASGPDFQTVPTTQGNVVLTHG